MASVDRILITGSSGVIGTALVERLLDEGYDVRGVDKLPNRWLETVDARTVSIDLQNEDGFSKLSFNPDIVVHLAANSRVIESIERPEKAIDNLVSTQKVFEYIRRTGASLIFGSSREVYGSRGPVCTEADASIDSCQNPYGASKVGCEALISAYRNCHDIDAGILRFSNVYGRYDIADRIIPKFIARAVQGDDLVIYGNEKILDFVYIDDAVSGILSAIEKIEIIDGECFNIGSGCGTSLVELAEKITTNVATSVDIKVEANRRGEVSKFVADLSKARGVLNYEPEYSLSEGIKRTIEWYAKREEVLDRIREQ